MNCTGNCNQGRAGDCVPDVDGIDATPDYSGEKLGLLIMLISGILSVAGVLHIAGWLGWLA